MFFKALNKHYPYNDSSKSKWQIILLFGLFISIFLIVFKPFGLAHVNEKHFGSIIILGYGLVTMILLAFNLLLLPAIFTNFFIEEKWLVYKEILWILFIVFIIGLGNFVYTKLIFSYPEFNFTGLLAFQFFTLIIAIIPISVLILIKQNILLKRNLGSANSINSEISNQHDKNIEEKKTEIISLLAENRKDKIELNIDDILFIESLGNYIKIHFIREDNIENKVLRNTLKQISKDVSNYKKIFQCHRAYIVNTSNIISVRGNAQGYKLKINNTNFEVPVARSYIKNFNTVMK